MGLLPIGRSGGGCLPRVRIAAPLHATTFLVARGARKRKMCLGPGSGFAPGVRNLIGGKV
jgi:hypothetical protein